MSDSASAEEHGCINIIGRVYWSVLSSVLQEPQTGVRADSQPALKSCHHLFLCFSNIC